MTSVLLGATHQAYWVAQSLRAPLEANRLNVRLGGPKGGQTQILLKVLATQIYFASFDVHACI